MPNPHPEDCIGLRTLEKVMELQNCTMNQNPSQNQNQILNKNQLIKTLTNKTQVRLKILPTRSNPRNRLHHPLKMQQILQQPSLPLLHVMTCSILNLQRHQKNMSTVLRVP
eukprot:NODE_172_length_14331_cov_0.709177.p13 type:complete len:111 gc:universal NODE_172_length_14331_cov_0.709177:10141-9809(-)